MVTTQISERCTSIPQFCSSDADMEVLSSDGVLFKVHCKNLEVHSDIFADATSTTKPENDDEIVHLSESSDVLDLLFQYMYRQPQPDLEAVDFPIFAGLAEAAEKYVVHSALGWCRAKMKASVTAHPLEVLNYAVRHGHGSLANECAPQSMGHAVSDAMEILAPDTFRTWVRVVQPAHNIQTNLNLVMRILADPKGCYAFRQELLQVATMPSMPIFAAHMAPARNPLKQQLEEITEMKFLREP
ncbi:hypothetical protein FB451DRAFT_1207906 [Mycena latifolia]|nr:hypothetical protein FB451DRAFT_1207906 [Mycena latifolia]